jgi:hypothetical protein
VSRKDLNLDGLEDFRLRGQATPQELPHTAQTPSMGWSRREASDESQFTIRAQITTIERFKKLCRPAGRGRFTYGEMLERLMDKADNQD